MFKKTKLYVLLSAVIIFANDKLYAASYGYSSANLCYCQEALCINNDTGHKKKLGVLQLTSQTLHCDFPYKHVVAACNQTHPQHCKGNCRAEAGLLYKENLNKTTCPGI